MSSKNYLSIYAKSFNWAGFFLPKKTYKNCSYLYDFCRVVDNIADDEGEIEIKKIKFQKFVSDFKQKNFEDPVIQNMWNIIHEFNISLEIIYDLFDGIESDIRQNVKIDTRKDLLIYCYRVAGTVGLMICLLYTSPSPRDLSTSRMPSSA